MEYLKDTNTVCQVLSRAKAGGGSLPMDEGSRSTTEKWLPDGRMGIHSHREPPRRRRKHCCHCRLLASATGADAA